MIIFEFYLTLLSLIVRLLTWKLTGKGKFYVLRRITAESILLRKQLEILNRKSGRKRVTLSSKERLDLTLCSVLSNSRRSIHRSMVVLSPATILKYHREWVRRSLRKFYSPRSGYKRGPKGKSKELTHLILELKSKNPEYGAVKIAGLLNSRGHLISERTVRRILAKGDRGYKKEGPPWLSFLGYSAHGVWSADLFLTHSAFLRKFTVMVILDIYSRKIIGMAVEPFEVDGPTVCKMFSKISYQGRVNPKRLSTDCEVLCNYERWEKNLSILGVEWIRSVPYVPESHPYVERVIGTIKLEFLDPLLFFGQRDLERKLAKFCQYYNEGRVHSGIDFKTPKEKIRDLKPKEIPLRGIEWKSYCYGMYQFPEDKKAA